MSAEVVPDIIANWIDAEKRQFEGWGNGDILFPGNEEVTCDQPYSRVEEFEVGDGSKRKRRDTPYQPLNAKKPISIILRIELEKQVNGRKFRTTGTDYTVPFRHLNVQRIINVTRALNHAFKHFFIRLTVGMAPHDQVSLILISQQLNRPISLPFFPQNQMIPQRFLAAVERVVQSNDQL